MHLFCLLIFIVHLFHDYGNSLSLICLSLWFCFSYMHLFVFVSLSLFLHLCTSGTFIFLSSGCNLWLLVTPNEHGKRPPTLKCRFHVHLTSQRCYVWASTPIRHLHLPM